MTEIKRENYTEEKWKSLMNIVEPDAIIERIDKDSVVYHIFIGDKIQKRTIEKNPDPNIGNENVSLIWHSDRDVNIRRTGKYIIDSNNDVKYSDYKIRMGVTKTKAVSRRKEDGAYEETFSTHIVPFSSKLELSMKLKEGIRLDPKIQIDIAETLGICCNNVDFNDIFLLMADMLDDSTKSGLDRISLKSSFKCWNGNERVLYQLGIKKSELVKYNPSEFISYNPNSGELAMYDYLVGKDLEIGNVNKNEDKECIRKLAEEKLNGVGTFINEVQRAGLIKEDLTMN